MAAADRAKELTPVELATLVVLDAAPAHGYEVARRLQVAFGEIGRFSFGSIYPALARLHRAGLIAAVGSSNRLDASRLPGVLAAELVLAASAAVGGRSRRTYRITEDGHERLCAELDRIDTADDRLATIALVAGGLLGDGARQGVRAARRRALAERLGELDRLGAELPRLQLGAVRARLAAELSLLEETPEAASRP
jgi:DNA-binding PadR family transcriptional regulator